MKNLPKIALVAAAALIAVLLIVWTVNAFGLREPLPALLINWILMSWVAFSGQYVHFSLPPGYFRINDIERSCRIYELLGVRLFKQIVRRGPLAVFSLTLRFPEKKTSASLHTLDSEMRKAEAGHLVTLLLVCLISLYALLRGLPDSAAWLTAFNILINGYPIMLQRYNRSKLEELIQETGLNEHAEITMNNKTK